MDEQTMNVDLLIIGGGCAGLSLANELSKLASPPSTVILEPRSSYVEDRTWCFWADQFSNPEQLPLHSWGAVSVKAGDELALLQAPLNPYQLLRSMDFYRDRLARIEATPNFYFRLGERAGESRKDAQGNWVTQSMGGPIISKFVVDSRPGGLGSLVTPALWQSFAGVEIELSEDTFQPEIADLMHFLPSDGAEVQFLYRLPIGRKRALIELTVLSANRPSFEELRSRLGKQLEQAFGVRGYEVVREEHGLIPMGIVKPPRAKASGYVHVGVGAGSARPSTGYTFCRIQRWARECAASMEEMAAPIGPIDDTPLVRQMDDIFLRVLRAHPELAPEIFVRMFDRVPSARLLRFLGDSPKVIDALCVVAALPKLPFLRELFPSGMRGQGVDGVSCFR